MHFKVILFITVLSSTITCNAQFKIGIEGNFNLSTISQSMKDETDEIPDKLKPTFSAGITGEMNVTKVLKVRAGIQYSSKGLNVALNDIYDLSGLDISGYDRIIINYIEFPCNLVYQTGIFQLHGGPYYAITLGGRENYDFQIRYYGRLARRPKW